MLKKQNMKNKKIHYFISDNITLCNMDISKVIPGYKLAEYIEVNLDVDCKLCLRKIRKDK